MFVLTANKKNLSKSSIMASNLASISSPAADSVHSALVSAVSKAGMSEFTESVVPKSIQKVLTTEWNFVILFKYHKADSLSEKNLSVNKNFIPWARLLVLT